MFHFIGLYTSKSTENVVGEFSKKLAEEWALKQETVDWILSRDLDPVQLSEFLSATVS